MFIPSVINLSHTWLVHFSCAFILIILVSLYYIIYLFYWHPNWTDFHMAPWPGSDLQAKTSYKWDISVGNNNSDKDITIYYKRGFIDDKIQDSQDFKTSVPKSKTQTYQYYNPYNQINVNMLSFSFPYIPWLLHCNVLKRQMKIIIHKLLF